MSAALSSSAKRRFEQTIVLLFIALPPLGGAIVLYQALQDPQKFWTTVGLVVGMGLLYSAHVKWVRPLFRRIPWVASYGELSSWSARVKPKHPTLVRRAWMKRLSRTAYRVGFAILLAPFFYGLYALHTHHFLWFVGMYLVAGFGITVGYHRGGAHPSYAGPEWLRGILVGCGICAMQGPPAEWIKKHTKHHTFSDTSIDPHSPMVFDETKRGIFKEQLWAFAHSFVMWAFREPSLMKPKNMTIDEWKAHLKQNPPDVSTFRYRDEDADYWEGRIADGRQVMTKEQRITKAWNGLADKLAKIEADRTLKFLSNPLVYLTILFLSFALPYWISGITFWESLARLLVLSWVTYGVNSVCHLWGETPFETTDNSKNNAFIEVLALGEGGHNTHHHRDGWAQHGVFHWQLDLSAWLIKGLKSLGLLHRATLPSKRELIKAWASMKRRAMPAGAAETVQKQPALAGTP